MVYNLRADVLQWDTAKKGWMLSNVVTRTIDSMKEVVTNAQTMKINLNVKPEDLRNDEYLKDKLTTPQLTSYIHAEELRGTEGLNTLKVEKYRRTATPFTVLLLTIIGAVIAIFLIGYLRYGLGLINVPAQILLIIIGLLLVGAVLVPNFKWPRKTSVATTEAAQK